MTRCDGRLVLFVLLAETGRKRRYRAAFVAKLSDAESEACETQVWIEFARCCDYLDESTYEDLDKTHTTKSSGSL